MIVWLTRAVSALSALMALGMVINALYSSRWQFWVGATACVIWAVGWFRLGSHWKDASGEGIVIFDRTSAIICLVMASALAIAALSWPLSRGS